MTVSVARRARVILTDIEGTTTPIAFVKEVLFPLARAALPRLLGERGDQPEIARAVDEVRLLIDRPRAPLEEIAAVLVGWIDEDRKVAPLKALQGMIWRAGYQSGLFQGPVYHDAAEQLRRWRQAGVRLAVYSSGSIAAQQLLFRHSDQGDLTPLFEAWFDLATGPKSSAGSYAAVAAALAVEPAEILFLSDSIAELDAARAAGLATCGIERGGARLPASTDHARAASFEEIEVSAAGREGR